jgi:hypothetical protein
MLTAEKPVSVDEIGQVLGCITRPPATWRRGYWGASEGYRGPLPVFGAAVRASIAHLRPPERKRLAAWGLRQAKKRADSNLPRVRVPAGALSKLKLSPPPTKAHRERTEHFLSWVLNTPL